MFLLSCVCYCSVSHPCVVGWSVIVSLISWSYSLFYKQKRYGQWIVFTLSQIFKFEKGCIGSLTLLLLFPMELLYWMRKDMDDWLYSHILISKCHKFIRGRNASGLFSSLKQWVQELAYILKHRLASSLPSWLVTYVKSRVKLRWLTLVGTFGASSTHRWVRDWQFSREFT